MASVGELLQSLEEDLQCPICFDRFQDPRILECHHTFCLVCLECTLSAADNMSVLVCPLCRLQTKVDTHHRAKSLPRNNYLANIIQTLESSNQASSLPNMFMPLAPVMRTNRPIKKNQIKSPPFPPTAPGVDLSAFGDILFDADAECSEDTSYSSSIESIGCWDMGKTGSNRLLFDMEDNQEISIGELEVSLRTAETIFASWKRSLRFTTAGLFTQECVEGDVSLAYVPFYTFYVASEISWQQESTPRDNSITKQSESILTCASQRFGAVATAISDWSVRNRTTILKEECEAPVLEPASWEAVWECSNERERIESLHTSTCLERNPNSRNISVEFTDIFHETVYIPVYICSYQHSGKSYVCIINGLTGSIEGEKPPSLDNPTGLLSSIWQ